MRALRPTSRTQFRNFLRERGVFGRRKPGEGKDDEKRKSSDEPEFEPKHGVGHYLLRYLQELRGQRGRLVVLLLMGILGVLLRATLPWTGKFMIDYVFPSRSAGLLVGTCALLGLIAVTQVLLSLLQDYTSRSLSGNFTVKIKRQVMKRLQSLSLARLQELKVGGVISRLQSDTEGMSQLMFHGLLTPLQAILFLIVGLGSLLFLTWKVTLICLAFCAIVVLCAWLYFNVMRPFQRGIRQQQADIQGRATEVFSGIQVVRAFGRERSEAHDYTTATHLLWRKGLYANVLSMFVHRTVWAIYWVLNVVTWLTAGYYVLQNQMTVGDLVAFVAFIEWLFHPIFMVMHSIAALQSNMACTERTFDLLDEPEPMPDRPNAVDVEEFRRGLRFEEVVFDYPDGTHALKGVSFEIPTGKVTALVGPSGAGKTTVTNLVMRFYDVTEGRLTVDGIDLRDLRLGAYRRRISLVLQDVFLFDGTVRENIAYGKPDATQPDIEEAARISHCHEFISELEDGYDTVIGERGVKLSGGQKQRIAIARAVLVKPQLLILDEATSFLDSESEALVQDALRHIFTTCTTLVIAHRLSTIMDADKIVVLDAGEMVEEGTHAELLQRRGRYWRLYTKQMEKAERHRAILDWNDDDGEGK